MFLKIFLVVLVLYICYYRYILVLKDKRTLEGRVVYKFESYYDSEYAPELEFSDNIEDSYVLIILNESDKEEDMVNVSIKDYRKVNINDIVKLSDGELEVIKD